MTSQRGSEPEPQPYAENALAHFDKGWAVFPAAPRAKEPLVKGRSGGYKSAPASREQIERELRRFGKANVGIRIPEDMVVLDLDYKVSEKVNTETGEITTVILDGADTFASLGLPVTISVGHTEDADGDPLPYRHHLYRVPEGVTAEDVARVGASKGGIDLIRWTHRLTLGRGSLHKSGEVYRWITKAGEFSRGIPAPRHATRLSTEEWERLVDYFGRSSGSGSYGVADVDVDGWLEAHAGSPSPALRAAFKQQWTNRTGGRHDAALRAVQRVAHLAEEGEAGAAKVVKRIEREFCAEIEDRSSEQEAAEEFERILGSAIGKAVSKTESGDREAEKIPEVTTLEIPGKRAVKDADRERSEPTNGSVERPAGWIGPWPKDLPDEVEPEPETIEAELGEEFSDTLVAMRIHAEWAEGGRHVVYSPGLGWLRWDRKRWRNVADEVVADAVQKYIKDWFIKEVSDGCSTERRGRLMALLSKPRQERLVRALRVVEVVEASLFDRDRDLLNVQNGIVDLRTGALLKHDPASYMTKIARVAYRKGAKHPDWEKAKKALDPARCAWLMGRFGQALTGFTPTDDKVVFLTGRGGNGKSTVVGPVLKALGSYAALVPATLLLGASDRHPAELMTLLGVRFALAEETPEEGRINVQRLKQIAGVAEMTARKMRQDFITFEQTHSLFVTTNYPPNVVETDHGTWRRLERCRFSRDYRTEDPSTGIDPTLHQRVDSDPEVWEAVLADLVKESVVYFENKQVMETAPVEIHKDTLEWRSDMDPLIEFFETHLETDDHTFVSSEELVQGLNEFLRSKSQHEWSSKIASQRVEQHEGLKVELGMRLRKDRQRLNNAAYSPRYVVAGGANTHPATVWWGARWAK